MYPTFPTEAYASLLIFIIILTVFVIISGKMHKAKVIKDDALKEVEEIILYLEFIEKLKPKSKPKPKSKQKSTDKTEDETQAEEEAEDEAEDEIIIYLQYIEKSKPKSKSNDKTEDEIQAKEAEVKEKEKEKALEKVFFITTKALGFIRYFEITNLNDAEKTLSEISQDNSEADIKDAIFKILAIANINKDIKCPYDNCFTTKIESLD